MLNVIVRLLPVVADVVVENPSVIFVDIVPASFVVNTKLGVVSLLGVETCVTAVNIGAVPS